MDVDVDLLGGKLQVEERDRHAADHQQPPIGLAQGVAQRAIADIAASQEEELALVARPALRRVGDIAPECILSSRLSTQSSDSASSRPKKTAIRSRFP